MRFFSSSPWCMLIAGTLCLFLISGCAQRVPGPEAPAEPGIVWNQFQDNALPPLLGFRSKASVNFSAKGQRHRVVMLLWGNWDLPIRMDIRAGIGSMLTHGRQSEQGLLLFFPRDNRAYLQPEGSEAPLLPGFDLPFSLRELGLVLTSQWRALVPGQYLVARKGAEGFLYTFPDDSPLQSLVLDPLARPVLITGSNSTTWTLEPDDWSKDDGRWVAGKMTLRLGTGERAVVHLKEYELLQQPWDSGELQFRLPDDVFLQRLSN